MKEDKEIAEESIKIPSDMLIDVLALIVREGLKHEVLQVIENRSLILLSVFYDTKQIRHQKIIQNIQAMLTEYEEFRTSESEHIDWREN